MDQDTSGAGRSAPTLTVLHVSGKLVELTFRAEAQDIEFIVDGVKATTVNREELRHWLFGRTGRPTKASGGGRPLLDLPLTMHRDEIGVWIEIRRHVAPTLIENHMIDRLIDFCY